MYPGIPPFSRALLVSHRGQRCGVFQFGARLFTALSAPGDVECHYAEWGGMDDLVEACARVLPDVVLLNYHAGTMPWAAAGGIERIPMPVCAVFHEGDYPGQEQELVPHPFLFLLSADPTLVSANPLIFPLPRFIPELRPAPAAAPEIFTVGSFGFGTPGKGFNRLCALVNTQFDTARIRINIPFHDNAAAVPRARLDAIVAACKAAVTKPGIRLEITHEFYDDDALMAFLAENTLNAFLYDDAEGRGISSCVDYALACGRPVAVSHSRMFRNLHGINPSVRVDDRPLAAIAASGIAPLRLLREASAPRASGQCWNDAIRAGLAARALSRGTPDGRGFNKILDDRARNTYTTALQDLHLAPEMLSRKIARANIQQAFGLDTAERLAGAYAAPRVLAIGSYEDTTVAVLRAKGWRIDEIDPNVNGMDLAQFFRSPEAERGSYDMILCISVLEHVRDDRSFVRMAADLLAPGGVAIFTVDFSNAYPSQRIKPAVDQRLYTTRRMHDVLMAVLPDCALVDPPAWDDDTDEFEFEGSHYSFASWVFRKRPLAELRRAVPAMIKARAAARLPPGWSGIEAQQALEELIEGLRMPAAPKALRMVLPLARLLRRTAAMAGIRTGQT